MAIAPESVAIMRADTRAFDLLFQRYFDSLTRQVARMVACEHIAEELVQDVFLRMWKGREDLAVHGDLGHYLRRAVRNRALDWLRREDVRLEWVQSAIQELGTTAAETPSPDQDEPSHLRTAITESLADMPERRRLVCELRWQANMGPSAIAARLRLSIKTVEAHLTRGTKDLRLRLKRLLE